MKNVVARGMIVAGVALLGASVWLYFVHGSSPIQLSVPDDVAPVEVGAKHTISITVHNQGNLLARIVGTNACWGQACDFGSKSLPIEIPAGNSFTFDVEFSVGPNQKDFYENTFDLYIDDGRHLQIEAVNYQVPLVAQSKPA